MKPFQIRILIGTLLLSFAASTHAAGGTFQERCEGTKNVTMTEGDLTTSVVHQDTCNPDQFLKCNLDKVCACKDPSNQIFTSKDFQVTERRRLKRSPKGNKGSKGMSAGKAVLVGAVAGVGAYQLNKAVDNIGSSHSLGPGTGSKKPKTLAIKGCYSRIGTKCAIDPDRTRQVVQTHTTTVNGTTTTDRTESTVNYRKEMSECVQNAECKVKTVRIPDEDLNIGECGCRDGFLHDPKTDGCVKVKRNGVENLQSKTTTVFLSVITLFYLI